MAKEKAMEYRWMVIGINTKDNGVMIKWMVMVKYNILEMSISISDNGKMVRNIIMVKSFMKMETCILDNGKMTYVNNEKSFLRMEANIPANAMRMVK